MQEAWALVQGAIAWSLKRDWRTWLCHALIALIIAIVVEPWIGLAYYWGREALQAYLRRRSLGSWTAEGVWRLDDVLDATAPLWFVSALVAAQRGEWLTVAVVAAIVVGSVVILWRRKRLP